MIKALFFLFSLWASIVHAQTIGTVYLDGQSSDDYILFSPISYPATYLIDKCGYVVNAWESIYPVGLAAVLDQDGNLFRTARIGNSTFVSGGGSGGIIEKYNWQGELLSSIVISSDSIVAHHDLVVMPNGNLLVSVWELISMQEAISLGRDPSLINTRGFWNERIIEIEFLLDDSYKVVWEWSALDHVIQDYDSNAPNYGEIHQNPGRLDINLGVYSDNIAVDWLHINSIDYNEHLDQVLLSSKSFSEIFIIDKSTSTIESQGASGGNADKGGDILYRWGNANNYLEVEVNQLLYGQHDANWNVDEYGFAEDEIVLFNNLNSVGGLRYSSGIEISLDRENYNYNFLENEINQEDDILWEYISKDTFDFSSKIMSGARRLNNGNYLLTEATKGRIVELDSEGEFHWEYICPVNAIGPMTQFDLALGNTIFKAIPYPKDYFNPNLNIAATGLKIEIDPIDNCNLSSITSLDIKDPGLNYVNENGKLKLSLVNAPNCGLILIDRVGQTLFSAPILDHKEIVIDVNESQLVYIIVINHETNARWIETIFIP